MTKNEKKEIAKRFDKIACECRLQTLAIVEEESEDFSRIYYAKLQNSLTEYVKELTGFEINFLS